MASVQAKTWITWNQRQNISPSKLRQNYQTVIIQCILHQLWNTEIEFQT